jgi:flagellar biosynthesis/type III secretory pathway chaperone
MDKQNCQNSLKQIMQQETGHTEKLLTLLDQERSLVSGNPEELMRVSEEKLKLIEQLELLNQKRNSIVQECGYAPDKQGMEACISWCSPDKSLHAVWQQLSQNVIECRSQNQLNGSVMDNSMRAIRQALSILYGQTSQESGYNASGSEVNDKLSRSIAKA